MFDLAIWHLINKIGILNPFKLFSGSCKICGKKNPETFIEYYLNEAIECDQCKSKARIYSKIIEVGLNIICKQLKMPDGAFKRVLKDNIALKRLITSYAEGLGIFGLKAPQVAAGPTVAIFSITDRCNLNCNHCYIHTNSGRKEMKYNEVCEVIDQLYNAKNMIVGFSGGEPLLREDLFDLIEYTTEKSMRVAIATNGMLISQSVAQKLKNSGAGYVQVSIDGLKKSHDKNRGNGVFQKAIKGIKNCLNAGLYVSMDVVITNLNVNQTYELVNLAKELEVQKIEFLDFVPSEKATNMKQHSLSPLQIERFGYMLVNLWAKLMNEGYPLTLSYKNPVFSRILAERLPNIQLVPFLKGTYPKDAVKFFNFSDRLSKGIFSEQNPFSPFVSGCECGIYAIHIKPNGEVTPCPLHPLVIGNIKKNDIRDIWLFSPILNAYRNLRFEGPCGKCTYRTICGGCRAKVYVSKKGISESDHTCYAAT